MTFLLQRQSLKVASTTVAGLAAAFVLFRFAVYEPPAVAPSALPTAAEAPAVVVSVEGEVEVGRGLTGTSWSTLSAGEMVHSGDVLRTGVHGKTDLRIDEKSRITIAESSEVRVRELTSNVHRFLLTRGRMEPDYAVAGRRILRVEEATGQTFAETRGARFTVLSSGTAIAVASTKGEVALASQGAAVTIHGGQQSMVTAGTRPSAPRPIPAALIVKVGNAITAASSTACAEVDGDVPAGSLVSVDGAPIAVDPGGHFRQRVPRTGGQREAVVEVIDPAGRRKVRTVACVPLGGAIKNMAIRWKGTP